MDPPELDLLVKKYLTATLKITKKYAKLLFQIAFPTLLVCPIHFFQHLLSNPSALSGNWDSLDPTQFTIGPDNLAGVCWPALSRANVMLFVMRNTNKGQQ